MLVVKGQSFRAKKIKHLYEKNMKYRDFEQNVHYQSKLDKIAISDDGEMVKQLCIKKLLYLLYCCFKRILYLFSWQIDLFQRIIIKKTSVTIDTRCLRQLCNYFLGQIVNFVLYQDSYKLAIFNSFCINVLRNRKHFPVCPYSYRNTSESLGEVIFRFVYEQGSMNRP